MPSFVWVFGFSGFHSISQFVLLRLIVGEVETQILGGAGFFLAK